MILAALLILILSFIAEMFLPWWSIATVAFAVGFVKTATGWKSFWAGFLGVGFLWWMTSGTIHIRTDGILTSKVAEMLTLPLPILVILITGLIGGLVGGLAASSGFHFRAIVKR
ncbi:MAG: hypothetical protein E2O77_01300 [Caldithrix sp.]|nr:MAG: hypothetical protein E2O77_01300 [Caldithrix sp.]